MITKRVPTKKGLKVLINEMKKQFKPPVLEQIFKA
jgi:hypothetical protein